MTPIAAVKMQELSAVEVAMIVRRRKGWNQSDAAKKAGVSLRSLRAWEQGSREPQEDGERRLRAFVRKFGG